MIATWIAAVVLLGASTAEPLDCIPGSSISPGPLSEHLKLVGLLRPFA